MTIRAVVFDIGNVLIEWNPERFYDRVLGAARRQELFGALDMHGMNDGVDRGEDFRATVTAFAEANPDWADEVLMWHDNWVEMASPAIDHSVRLLRALKRAGVPVFALSNFGVQTYQMAIEHYPFLEEFDRAYVSGRMRRIKPDPEIYEMLEGDSGVPPHALLFTDDRPANIDAAAARGWRTHLFDRPEGFAARLVAEGLLREEEAR